VAWEKTNTVETAHIIQTINNFFIFPPAL